MIGLDANSLSIYGLCVFFLLIVFIGLKPIWDGPEARMKILKKRDESRAKS
jgi:hypothetical protein